MTITVEIEDAPGQLSDLLAKVEAGDDIILARGRTPVARLTKLDPFARARAAADAILEMRSKLPRTTMEEIFAWKDEDRR